MTVEIRCRICSAHLAVDAKPIRGCEGYVACGCGVWNRVTFPPAPTPPPIVDEDFDGDEHARKERSAHTAALYGGL